MGTEKKKDPNRRSRGRNDKNSVDDNNENENKKIKTGEVSNDANSTNTTTNSGGDSELLQSINGELMCHDNDDFVIN